jgi:CBS domain-containing protein
MKLKRVSEIMTEAPIDTIEQGFIQQAANIMKERKRGSLVVTDNKKAVGIITERDIVRRVVAEGRDIDATKVKDIMSTPLISISSDATVEAAAKVMYENSIRRFYLL